MNVCIKTLVIRVIKTLHSINEISIKNRPYYFFNEMVNIKNFAPSLLERKKLSPKSAKLIFITLNL